VARLSLALEGTSMTKEPPVPDANPPRWAERLLRLVLSPRDRETVTGDLLEEYREVAVPTLGPFRARMWYLREMVGFMKNASAAAVVGLSAVISLAVVIGSAVLFVFMHRDSSMTSAETADRQFQALRARFAHHSHRDLRHTGRPTVGANERALLARSYLRGTRRPSVAWRAHIFRRHRIRS
jgi:hypothetical protein